MIHLSSVADTVYTRFNIEALKCLATVLGLLAKCHRPLGSLCLLGFRLLVKKCTAAIGSIAFDDAV